MIIMGKKIAHKMTKKIEDSSKVKNIGEYSTNWKGRIYITDPKKSYIANVLKIEEKGEYAIKVR